MSEKTLPRSQYLFCGGIEPVCSSACHTSMAKGESVCLVSPHFYGQGGVPQIIYELYIWSILPYNMVIFTKIDYNIVN